MMRNFLMGLITGLIIAGAGAFAQLFPDPFQQQGQPQKSLEQQLQEYSIMRDGGTSYQKSFQHKDPC
jgi:hypothetical protein